MTRIFNDGAEMQDTSGWTSGPSVQPGGLYSSYHYSISGNGPSCYRYLPTSASAMYLRTRMSSGGSQYGQNIGFRTVTSGDIAKVYVNSSTQWSLYVRGGAVWNSGIGVSWDTWYLVELYCLVDDSVGIATLRINGIELYTYNGDTKPGSETTIGMIFCQTGGFNANLRWDDMAVNDTLGTSDNSWCGDGVIIRLSPSGSGTTNQWLNSGSVSGSANYLYVDDFPSDSDTTYVYCSGSLTGSKDRYKLSTFSGTNKKVLRIYPEIRAKKSVADLTSLKIGYLPSGGTDQLSGSIALSIAYAPYIETSASLNPVSGSTWTEADINALQFVAEI